MELGDYWLEGEQSYIWGTSMNKLTGYIIVSIDPSEYLMQLGFCKGRRFPKVQTKSETGQTPMRSTTISEL